MSPTSPWAFCWTCLILLAPSNPAITPSPVPASSPYDGFCFRFFFDKICQFYIRTYWYIPIWQVMVRTNGEKKHKTMSNTNEQTLEVKGQTRMEYKQRGILVKDKPKIKTETRQRLKRLMHWKRRAAPSPENDGRVLNRLTDRTLRLRGRWYRESRNLRWKKYGCCSNSIITCYNKRFLNVP